MIEPHPLRSHPDYADGYQDGWDGEPLTDGVSTAYSAGHAAALSTIALFEEHGMFRDGDCFSIKMEAP